MRLSRKKRCDRRSHLFFLQPLNKFDSRQLAGLTGFLPLLGLLAPCVKLLLCGTACANTGKSLLVLAAIDKQTAYQNICLRSLVYFGHIRRQRSVRLLDRQQVPHKCHIFCCKVAENLPISCTKVGADLLESCGSVKIYAQKCLQTPAE